MSWDGMGWKGTTYQHSFPLKSQLLFSWRVMAIHIASEKDEIRFLPFSHKMEFLGRKGLRKGRENMAAY